MVNYDKFEAVADSDDEAEVVPRGTRLEEEMESRRGKQAEVSSWLKEMIAGVAFDEKEGKRSYQSPDAKTPFRRVTREERDALAMFIVTCYAGDSDTNLPRYPEITKLVLDHRWMEEDPGTLELLCRVHLRVQNSKELTDLEGNKSMNSMVLSAINTLSATSLSKSASTLVELFAQICTPKTEEQLELRRKWEKKEFAKEALLTSMFPDLAKYKDFKPESEDVGWGELAFYIGMAVVALIMFGVVIYMTMTLPSMNKSARKAKHVTTAPSLVPSPVPGPIPVPFAEELLPDRGEL